MLEEEGEEGGDSILLVKEGFGTKGKGGERGGRREIPPPKGRERGRREIS